MLLDKTGPALLVSCRGRTLKEPTRYPVTFPTFLFQELVANEVEPLEANNALRCYGCDRFMEHEVRYRSDPRIHRKAACMPELRRNCPGTAAGLSGQQQLTEQSLRSLSSDHPPEESGTGRIGHGDWSAWFPRPNRRPVPLLGETFSVTSTPKGAVLTLERMICVGTSSPCLT